MSAVVRRLSRSLSPTRAPEWELGRVVRELRLARADGAGGSHAGRRSELPSREALHHVVDGLRAALFPTHFGPRDLSEESVDYFVGHTLDATLRLLFEQVQRELGLHANSAQVFDSDEQAYLLTRALSAELPRIRTLLQGDVDAAMSGDPAATNVDEVVLCYPGIAAMVHHRIAHALYRLGAPLLARMISELAHAASGIDIHPGAQIAERCFIDHGTGVVIGETSVIGARVRLYQGVTLGAKSFPIDEHGDLVRALPRHPILQDDVVIYAGATVLGRVTIGEGSTIGGNVWITQDVPPRSRITQAGSR